MQNEKTHLRNNFFLILKTVKQARVFLYNYNTSLVKRFNSITSIFPSDFYMDENQSLNYVNGFNSENKKHILIRRIRMANFGMYNHWFRKSKQLIICFLKLINEYKIMLKLNFT